MPKTGRNGPGYEERQAMLRQLAPSVVLSVLFWGQANSVMNVAEAKKYYVSPQGPEASLLRCAC